MKFAMRYVAASTSPQARLHPIAPDEHGPHFRPTVLRDADRAREGEDHDQAENDLGRALQRIEDARRLEQSHLLSNRARQTRGRAPDFATLFETHEASAQHTSCHAGHIPRRI